MPVRTYGITPPISTAGPTPEEETVTESLLEELTRQNSFESEEEAKSRYGCYSLTFASAMSPLNELRI